MEHNQRNVNLMRIPKVDKKAKGTYIADREMEQHLQKQKEFRI